jgi:hypothetical protein
MLPNLPHGQETQLRGHVGPTWQRYGIRQHGPGAEHFIQVYAHCHRPLSEVELARNGTKSKVRAELEALLLVMSGKFGWSEVRDRGLAKHSHRLFIS